MAEPAAIRHCARRLAAGWRPVAALLILHLALVLPDRPDQAGAGVLLRLPIELPLALLLLLMIPVERRRWPGLALAGALAVLSLLRLADMAAFTAFARPARLPADLPLTLAGWDFLSGAFGLPAALATAIAAGTAFVALAAALAWAAHTVGRTQWPRGGRRALGTLSLAGLLGAVALPAGLPGPLTAQATEVAVGHTTRMLAQFRQAGAPAVPDPFAAIADDRLLAGLRGTDVLVVFVESYGRTSLEDPRYAETTAAALQDFEAAATKAGFAARSGWLTSSVFGGQSWLAHASLLTGGWIETPGDYSRMLAAGGPALTRDFARAGWRSVAVKPGITAAWPEGRFYGYDRIYAADDLGYAGAPFNWITMPDQYTLGAFAARELAPADRPPLLAEITLVSSHAPWTPLPPLLPWAEIGDGRVYTPYAMGGDPPETVWRDPARVQHQYAASIDYTLRSLAAFVAEHGRRNMLILVLGDHQPMPIVSGDTPSHDVPIHILAGDPALLTAIDGWGWTAGLRPDAGSPIWRMDTMRAKLLEAFTPEEDAVAAIRAAPPS